MFSVYSISSKHTPIEIEGAYDVHDFEVNGIANQKLFLTRFAGIKIVVNKSLDGLSSDGHVMFWNYQKGNGYF